MNERLQVRSGPLAYWVEQLASLELILGHDEECWKEAHDARSPTTDCSPQACFSLPDAPG